MDWLCSQPGCGMFHSEHGAQTMKKVIWKFPLPEMDNEISMPEGAQILTVQIQNGQLVLWAMVDPHAFHEKRLFRIIATGEDIHASEKWKYVGTFQKAWFVGHVFEWLKS